jgi:GLPGLI family protein
MKYKLSGIIIFIPIIINAQMNFFPKGPKNISTMSVIDSGSIKITYALNNHSAYLENYKPRTKKDSIWFSCNICAEDIHLLEIGKTLSKYYSYNVFTGDSIFTDFITKNPRAQSAPNRNGRNPTISNKYFWSEYYKDYAENTITEYACMPLKIPNYYYEEEIPDFNWKIQNDTLTVIDYLCQKATCSFRGKNYTAWFTTDIPINNGPWKFGGLPGLILTVYDDRRDYIFECISIVYCKDKFAIRSSDYSNYAKISREKLLKLWADIIDHYFQLADIVFSGNYKPEKLSYNPIELE